MHNAQLPDILLLSVTLAQRHYEHLRYHEDDPLDVPWDDLPELQKDLWTASMSDLLQGLTAVEVHRMAAAIT